MITQKQIEAATLVRQSYGIAMAQGRFGGPRGVWLECKGCDESSVIVGSNSADWVALPDADVARVFRRHGWTGEGDRMLKAHCPACSAAGQWQPIATAPRDGKPFQARYEDGSIEDGVYWAEERYCILGAPQGSKGPGCMSPEAGLPVEPVQWRRPAERR